MAIGVLLLVLSIFTKIHLNLTTDEGQCSLDPADDDCDKLPVDSVDENKYEKDHHFAQQIIKEFEKAMAEYQPCATDTDTACSCYKDVIENDLRRYRANGISRAMLKESEIFGSVYKIINHKLFRSPECMFPARCQGVEHFLLQLAPDLPDTELVINTRDQPQLPEIFHSNRVVFSFSKNENYVDIMYPAWTFWAGGPAILLFPTGIGRWDKLRISIMAAAKKYPWSVKKDLAFFRGSRTSDERDSLVLLSRKQPDLVDAKFTKNQAWKSPEDTLHEEPATEVSFEDHCKYKYLFNFRGVTASFRFKHLFLCKSLVFHVGDQWTEFFYYSLKPWVHYVPLHSYPSEAELEQILTFFHKHTDLAQEIANRGYEFIKNHLKMSDIECYWRRLLLDYSKLLKFTIIPDKTYIEIQ